MSSTATTPRVSFITATYDCLELTRAFLDSLRATVDAHRFPFELILIDDASRDGTPDFLRGITDLPARVLLNEVNQGYAASNNRGARAATGELLFFLNNDLVLQPGWLEPMVELLEATPDIGAVGNVQIDPRTGRLDHAGVYFDLDGSPRHARKFRREVPTEPTREWPAVTGACMGMRREVFLAAGGFDLAYRNGCEDVDLCLRLRESGHRHLVCHHSVVLHHVSSAPSRHEHDKRNHRILMARWQDTARRLTRDVWPEEFVGSYVRHWWNMNERKFACALWLVLVQRIRELARPGEGAARRDHG